MSEPIENENFEHLDQEEPARAEERLAAEASIRSSGADEKPVSEIGPRTIHVGS